MARPSTAPPLSYGRFLRDLVVVLGASALVVFAVTGWIAMPWVVEGRSMVPTLHDGDRVIVTLASYRSRSPRIGDVVLVDGPLGVPLVKRVALPPPERGAPPHGGLWVLGDNPLESSDSRAFGPIPIERVRGRVAWRYWPPSRWGSIE